MIYVTYHWRQPGGRSNTKAIACANIHDASSCAYDLASVLGICNVRINMCGVLRKNTTVIPWNKYKSGEYIHL